MDEHDKILRYSIQLRYLRILLKDALLSEEEYVACIILLRKDYGIDTDILVDI